MEVLTERQKLLLAIIVQEFTQSAQPVGSKSIQKKYKLDMSPATIRNEMALLVDNGYLRQPHTSAGRVPTEEGYRYFVRQLMGNTDLPVTTKETISHQFYQARQDTEEWMRLAASILATQSNAASLVTAPQHKQHLFKHLVLISVGAGDEQRGTAPANAYPGGALHPGRAEYNCPAHYQYVPGVESRKDPDAPPRQ
jgi:heat-inducible transcriptional repressor